ncbi:MAG TPA: DUF2252 family protein [Dongiaceae bacterium]|nr:DUF2252 family protein [Dongiaceae bacterium]
MASSAALINRLVARDKGRMPALLARKYRRMAADAFAFFRGSGHLFHADFPKGLKAFPAVWLNGDLHLENFGTYRGENRLTYFDIGDFDEGGLGPASRDLLRFLVSLHLAMPLLDFSPGKAKKLAKTYLAAYRDALSSGKALWLERDLTSGLIGALMHRLDKRLEAGDAGSAWLRSRVTGAAQLDARSKKKGTDARRLRLDTGKILPVTAAQRGAVAQAIRQVAWQQHRLGHGKWRILDIGWRVAGLGTLGLPRFIVLIRVAANKAGERMLSTEGDLLLLDVKFQPGSVMAPQLKKQPRFASEAERVVAIERRLQAMNPAFLTSIQLPGVPLAGDIQHKGGTYTLRELQPEADKLDLHEIRAEDGLDFTELQQAIDMMGRLTAWAQLRSAGRQGSVEADALIDFGGRSGWVGDLLTAGEAVAAAQRKHWQATRDWLQAEAGRLAPGEAAAES